ncbi:hypothetical protein ACWC98_33005 [Streptomyces goshikiensis]
MKALTDAMVKAETEAKARETADAKEAKDAEVMQAVVRDLVDTKHVAATLSTLRITCHQDTVDSLARIAFDSATWSESAHPWHGRVSFNDDDTVTVAISGVQLVVSRSNSQDLWIPEQGEKCQQVDVEIFARLRRRPPGLLRGEPIGPEVRKHLVSLPAEDL